MQKITLFILKNCPHCIRALAELEKIRQQSPELSKVEITMVDEAKESQLASRYDYYYVPTFYVGDVKVHEGVALQPDVEKVLQMAAGKLPIKASEGPVLYGR